MDIKLIHHSIQGYLGLGDIFIVSTGGGIVGMYDGKAMEIYKVSHDQQWV